jgi:hypothetical protein
MKTIAALAGLLFLQDAKVKITVDVTQVTELQEWGDRAKALCEEWYPKMSDYLSTDGFTPPQEASLIFEKDRKGVAATSGAKIRIAADWVKKHPEDLGMVIHELAHVVQSYKNGSPGWVTEGIADYVRYFLYEKKAVTPKDKRKGSYKDAYRTTASFFAWLVGAHDKEIVKKLNAAMRGGKYSDDLFKDWTGKDLETLWKDYLAAD